MPAVYYKSCECGETSTDTFTSVNALGHDFTVKQYDENQHWNKCSRCDATSKMENHSGGVATCTEQPVCSECGYKYGNALGHDYVHHDAKAATCTEKGWKAYDTCSRCDYTTYEEISAAGHTAGAAVRENEVAATCTSAGSYDEVIYCTVCKAEISRESKTTPAAGHSFGAWTVVKEATCTAEGHKTRVCSVCSAKEDKDIGKLSHEESDWITDENNHWKICTVCNAVIEDETAHTFGNWVIDENATEATEGSRHRECIICGHINRETIPELGHTHIFDREVTEDKYLKSEATCTMPAVYYKSCECGETSTDTFTSVNALGHDFIVLQHDENQHWKKCSRCDVTDTKENHIYDNEQDNICNVCGYNRGIAPAHTHNWADAWSHNTAYHWHECLSSDCDVAENSLKDGYAAHIEAAAVRENETAATCTTDGSYDEVVYCTDCHAEISRTKNITKALDHEWGNWVVTKPVTSSEDGEEQRICMRDSSHVETKIIPALTHTHQYSEVVKDEYIKTVATCTEPAVYYTSCECGKRGADTFTSGDVLGHDFTIMQHDENQHWKKCSRCDVTDTKSNHVYDNEQDNICNVCGYNWDIAPAHTHNWADTWSHNTAYHWHECLNSGCDVTENSLKDGYAEHVPGDPATETKPQICTECGYIIQVAQGHTHTLIKVDGTPATCTEEGVKDYWKCSECGKLFENEQGTAEITDTGIPAKGHSYSSVWSSDTACHWHQCIACIAETDKAAHIWGTGVITTPPTTTEEGIKTYTCEVCGTAKTESVPKRHSGGGVTPPKKDTITVDLTGDKTSVKITAEISGDTASIAEIGRNDIDKAGAGVDITIDLTVLPNEIAEVTVTKNSLENIYDSETDNVSIKLTETTVNMDRATLKNIIEQMNGSDLKLVVDKHQDALESMNKAQKDTLKGMKNPKLIDAYFISGGIRITDFKGGSVEIKVPYSDKKSKSMVY